MTAVERGLRRWLDDWRFWVGVAYFGVVAVVIWLFILNQDVTRVQAEHAAQQAAAANSTLSSCYQRARNNPDLVQILDAIKRNAENTVKANRAAIVADPSSPLVKVRQASIQRAGAVVASIERFRGQILTSTPSEARCDALAAKLGLPPQ